MPNGILDPDDFTIPPDSMRSLQDRMLELRRGLPDVLQGPQVGGQPQQTQQEQTNQGLGDKINQAAQMLADQTVQQQSQKTGEKPSRKGVQTQLDEYQSLLDQLNPMKPKASIGGGSLGQLIHGKDQGGIFGTGIQPVDVLAFALGAAITSRMPQDKAIATTMGIAKMPGEFRDYQEKKIGEFIQNKLHGINAEISTANAETAQINSAQAQQKFNSRTKLANAFRLAGRESEALALEAGAVDEYEKLTGENAKLPANLQFFMSGVASGSIKDIPPALGNILGGKTPEENRTLARGWLDAHLLTQPVIPMPGGGAVQRSTSGSQIVESAPSSNVSRSLTDISKEMQAARGGGAGQQAPVAPRLGPTPSSGSIPPLTAAPGRIAQPVQNTEEEALRSQWASYGEVPPKTQNVLTALFQRPLDVSVRQKLVAQRSVLDYGEELGTKYDEMVKSYGGDKNFKFTEQMKQWVITQGSRISGEGLSGAVLSAAADMGRAFAQRFGRPLTPEAMEFMSLYNQAQKFARGAMNDAANLATRERDMFNGMLGKPLDTPAFFRATNKALVNEIAREYNNNLKANQLSKITGLEPFTAKQERQWIPMTPQAPIQPGQEY